jgi:hypothetical protein
VLALVTSADPGLGGQSCLHGVAQSLVDPGLCRHGLGRRGLDVGMHGFFLRGVPSGRRPAFAERRLQTSARWRVSRAPSAARWGRAATAAARARRSIRHLADDVAGRARLSAGMEVHIWLDQSEPPVGRLTVTGPPAAPGRLTAGTAFTGWLGLLRALSDAIDSSEDFPPVA